MDERRNNWIAVASADSVARSRDIGLLPVGQGIGAALERMRSGDRVACYSPARRLGGNEPCQAFTAIGTVRDDPSGLQPTVDDFGAFQTGIDFDSTAQEAPIHPLMRRLLLTRDKTRNWSQDFRLGLIEVSDDDMDAIALAMGAMALVDGPAAGCGVGLSMAGAAGAPPRPSHVLDHAPR